MRLTTNQLRRMIKEEARRVIENKFARRVANDPASATPRQVSLEVSEDYLDQADIKVGGQTLRLKTDEIRDLIPRLQLFVDEGIGDN